MTGTFDDDG